MRTQHLGAGAMGIVFRQTRSRSGGRSRTARVSRAVCTPKIIAPYGQTCLYTHDAYKLTEDLSRQANTLQRIALVPRLEAPHKSELLGFL